MPPVSPRFGAPLGRANFSSPSCTFKISRYAAHYWYLKVYEINAQGWKKRLGLEGLESEGGECTLKIFITKGGIIFISNYFGVGGKVLIHHTFLKTPAPI